MVQKRPFAEECEEFYEVSSKHARQFEHSGHLVSFLEFPSGDMDCKPHTSGGGKGGLTLSVPEHDMVSGSGNNTELPTEEVENSFPGGISNSSWASSCTSEEDIRLDAPFHTLVSPKCYDSDRPTRSQVYSEDLYSSLWEHTPKKLVQIGSDFQADVPEWCPGAAKDTPPFSNLAETLGYLPQACVSNLGGRSTFENRFVGTCIIPMPEVEPSACHADRIVDGRIFCYCEDPGSVNCARIHIIEARENIRRDFGQEVFFKLGFFNMGEVVAEKWNEVDQQFFQEVVFSNPSSSGRNFWEHLSEAFPSRTTREIVSYYFNVFMLRRRAEQNRCDPTNIDSDDDECQYGDDETSISEEDEDSVVESPAYQGFHGGSGIHEVDSHDCANLSVRSSHAYDVDFIGGKGIANMSETCPRKLHNNPISDSKLHLSQKTLLSERGNHGTNYHSEMGSQIKVDSSKSWACTFNGMSSEGGYEFFLEASDIKVWDVGYFSCPRNDVEFLPTCSMIEEVFGAGAWDYEGKDGKQA